MHSVLERYGIKVIEIQRKKVNNEVISASRVRQLLFDDDFEKIKSLVLEESFSMLEKYKNIGQKS